MYMCGMSHRTVDSHHIEAWVDGDRKRGKERVKGGYREKGGGVSGYGRRERGRGTC